MIRIAHRWPPVTGLILLASLVAGCDDGASTAALAIKWQDLMPTDYRPNATLEQIDVAKWADNDPQAVALMDQLRSEWQNAPLVERLSIRRLFDTVAVTGRFNTERRTGELADAGYVLDATEIELVE
jgi:hypothetical protein